MKLRTIDGLWWEAVDPYRAQTALHGGGGPIAVTPVIPSHSPDVFDHPLKEGGYVAAEHVIAWSDPENDPDED